MRRKSFLPIFALSALTSVSFGLSSEVLSRSLLDFDGATQSSVELIACGGGGGGAGGGGGGGGKAKREGRKSAQEALRQLFKQNNSGK